MAMRGAVYALTKISGALGALGDAVKRADAAVIKLRRRALPAEMMSARGLAEVFGSKEEAMAHFKRRTAEEREAIDLEYRAEFNMRFMDRVGGARPPAYDPARMFKGRAHHGAVEALRTRVE